MAYLFLVRPMQQDNTIWIVCDFAMPILSLAFLFLAFAPKYRRRSAWLRSVSLILGINGLVWSALAFTLLLYASHLTRHVRISLDLWMSHLGGIGLGLLISLILSPDFREMARRSSRPNQSLEPTADRRDDRI